MDHAEAQERMQEIQRIMERATLWTLLPGFSAIIGGVLVLGGCAASYAMFRSLDFADILKMSFDWQVYFCVMWFLIAVVSILLEAFLRGRAAKRQGISPTIRSARLVGFSLAPSVIIACVLTVKFLIPNEPSPVEIRYIVPMWMMLYGTGVYTAGLFSLRPPRIVGMVFILFGIISLFCFEPYGVITAALSFGLIHIVFGTYILVRQRQDRLS